MDTSPCCRGCGGVELLPVLDLGLMPLANHLLTDEKQATPEPRYPLKLAFCTCCALVQITETVPPEKLFGDYVYFSSCSKTAVEQAATLTQRLMTEHRLNPSNLVIELASNDGYLLQHYVGRRIPVLGIEPAANVAQVAEQERNVPTMVSFFSETLAGRLRRAGMLADVIHANNVLAHVPQPSSFLRGIERILLEGGVAVIEVPHVVELVERTAFDTIYHEHLSYFSLTVLQRLAERCGLFVYDVERLPTHGGSLRLFFTKRRNCSVSERVKELLEEEAAWGVLEVVAYRKLAEQVERLRANLMPLLRELKSQGHRIAAYGASAKGCMLMNQFGIDRSMVDFVVDLSIHKQERWMPGVHVPISAPERLLAEMPDEVLLLAWNLEAEVMAQQAEYRRRGGRFLIPVPVPRFVT